MSDSNTLSNYLAVHGDGAQAAAVAAAIEAIAAAAIGVSDLISLGDLGSALGTTGGQTNADGDTQKALDVIAHERFIEAFAAAPIASVASEEAAEPVVLDRQAPLAVAIDPLDGSSNIDTNVSIGTIFSILPASDTVQAERSFLVPGRQQLAAGFVVYGPQTSLVLTTGAGTHVFTLDRERQRFLLARASIRVPPTHNEYAINASNYRHWEEPVRNYIDDCLAGKDGPRGANFNMRWIASLVADAYRILMRGGIFLYPGDGRAGYAQGRLRLIYEANPVAMVFEQAGGAAYGSVQRILDVSPQSLHQRTPLVFGSAQEVERVVRYHTEPNHDFTRSPLFARRGLLRV